MPGPKSIIGYKPERHPGGWGETSAGTMRGTTIAGRSTGYWITRLGGRFGKEVPPVGVGADTTMRIGVFASNKASLLPEGRLGNTNTFPVRSPMADSVSGGDYEEYVLSPIKVAATIPVTLAPLGTGAPWVHGQDHSGALMHERSGLGGGLPLSFNSTWTRAEGRIAVHAVIFNNVAPTIPLSTVSPRDGGSTVDETPTLAMDFRSLNEQLPGFDIGEADVVSAYQFHVYNLSKTTRLRNSGKLSASSAQKTARRVSYTVVGDLPPGRYVVRGQVFNAFDSPSLWREWTIEVVGAGNIVPEAPDGITNDTTPDFSWTYSHKQSLAMDVLRAKIVAANGTTVVRDAITHDYSPNPVSPSSGVLEWSTTGWAALPAGVDYGIMFQAVDTDNQPSPWSSPLMFHVNARPSTPNFRTPLPGTVTTVIPELVARAVDPDDPTTSLITWFKVKKQGASEYDSAGGYYNATTNRWSMQPMLENIITPGDYGFWEWSVFSVDPHGLTSVESTQLTFEYAAPPVITIVQPTGVVATASPTFSWLVNRTQTSYRLQLFDMTAGGPVRDGDTGWITSSTTNHTFSSLTLRHDRQIRAQLDLITTGDVPGSITWEFDVSYTPPASITGVTTELVEMPFDFMKRYTGIKIEWDQSLLDNLTFDSYVVYRRNPVTNVQHAIAMFFDINQTQWIDDTAPAGVQYEFIVTQRAVNDLDLVESNDALAIGIVPRITGLVLSTVIGGNERVVLPAWDDITVDLVTDKTVQESWAQKPQITVGPTGYNVIEGTSPIADDEFRNRYTTEDIIAVLKEMSLPFRNATGRLQPKVLCARLYSGESFYVVLQSFSHSSRLSDDARKRQVSITLVETSFTGVS